MLEKIIGAPGLKLLLVEEEMAFKYLFQIHKCRMYCRRFTPYIHFGGVTLPSK